MFTHSRSHRLFCLAFIVSLLLNLVSPLSLAWKPATALAAANTLAPSSSGDNAKLESAAPSPSVLRSQATTQPRNAASQPGQDPAATAAAAVRRAPIIFVENVGQFDRQEKFRAQGAGATIRFVDNALWFTFLSKPPKPSAPPKPPAPVNGVLKAQLGESEPPRQGVHLKMSFVGANQQPHLEPFDRLTTRVSYYLGNEPSKWHSNVPVWAGVRFKDLYPGIDLELSSESGQFVMRMVAQPGADPKAVRMHLDGANSLSLKGSSQVTLATAIGEQRLPLLQLLQANRTRLSTAGLQPRVAGTDIVQPFAADGLSGASTPISALESEGSGLLYSSYFGGSGGDRAEGISVDASGAAYIVGTTSSTDLPTQAGAFTSNSGLQDAFVTKFNPSGSDLVFSTYLGGTNDDVANGIAVDASGAAYVAGTTRSTNFPTMSPTQPSYGGGDFDIFVAKFDSMGSLLFSTYLGGSYDDATGYLLYLDPNINGLYHGNTIAVDPNGNFYVVGSTESPDSLPPPVTKIGTLGASNTLVVKYSPDFSRAYATIIGAHNDFRAGDTGMGIAVDATGAAYVTGFSYSPFPQDWGGTKYIYGGGNDGGLFVYKLTPDGSNLQYATFFLTDNSATWGTSIAIDPSGAAYAAGQSTSPNFPTTEGAYDRTCGTDGTCNYQPGHGLADAVAVKLRSDGSREWGTYLGGSDVEGDQVQIALDRYGFVYLAGYTYSSDFPTKFAFDSTYGGNGDAFLTKLDPAGSTLVYSTFLGGSGGDSANGVAVDANGTAYLAGGTGSSDFPTRLAYQEALNGGDAFVTRLSTPLPLPDSHVRNTRCPECDKAGDPRVGATSAIVGSNGAIVNKGGPINTRTGGVDYTTVDLSFPALGGQMVFQRSYSSLATNLFTTTLGYGWTHNQDTRLMLPGSGALGGGSGLLAPSKTSASTATAGGGTPILFIENVGQFDDGSRFQVRGAQGTLFLAPDAIWLTALEPPPSAGQPGATDPNAPGLKDDKSTPRKGVSLKESFPGAKAQPKLEPFNRLKTHVSYFAGKDPKKWHADVPVWGGVRYKDLYPGIDLEVTSEKGQLVQRLVARSGANLDAVRLRLEGANSLAVEAGRVKAATSVGALSLPLLRAAAPDGSPAKRSQTAPAVKGNEVTAPFAASTAVPRTALATTGEGALELLYSTFLGGSDYDYGRAIAVDQAGQAYATGDTDSSDMPVVPGSFDTSFASSGVVYVAKLNTVGSGLEFATFLGEGGSNEGHGIALDNNGNVYVTGQTNDPNFPINPPGVVQPVRGGSNDAFVTKLAPTGTMLLYSTFLGGSGSDSGYGIAVNGSEEALVTGVTYSSNFPVREGAWSMSRRGSSDAFVTKLNDSGTSLVYSTYLGGNSSEWGWGIALDASGNAFVTGQTSSTDFWTPGAFDTSLGGTSDAFVTKLNPTGSDLVYSTYLGGFSWEGGKGIAVDGSGAAYVTGDTGSSDFPKRNPFDSTYGSDEGFVTKVNVAGSDLDYSTFLGGSGDDSGTGIAVNGSGQAVVTGYTNSTNFPPGAGGYDTSFNGGYDAFVTELSAAGNEAIYSTYVGGSAIDQGNGVAVDASGAMFVVGQTNSLDWPATPGAFQTICNNCSLYGWSDIFVLKIGNRPAPPAAPGQILFKPHNANQLTFTINADGTYSPYPGVLASLVATTAPPGYRLTASDQSVYVFDTAGRLLTWADAQGHTWLYSYDNVGRLLRVQDPTGQRYLNLDYDPSGRLSSVRDPLGRTVQYGYDANGDLATYTDARSRTWTYHYLGSTHLLTEVVDPLGHTVERTEYDQGRAVRQFDGNGVKTLDIQYNLDNTRIITDAVGSVTTATYDARGTATSVQDAAGQTQKQFDANFRPSQIIDPNTHPTSLTWSADGANLTQVVDAKGMTTTLSYDSLNNLTRTVDALGRTSNFTYDPGSRLLRSSTDDLGNTTLYTYTAQGFLQAQTDARLNTTNFTYNAYGQRTSITDAQTHTTYFDYDPVGRLVTTTTTIDGQQRLTVNEYDNEDHLTKVTQNYVAGSPQNYLDQFNIITIITQYGYDNAGRQTFITNTLNYVTKNDYDPAGRLIKVTQNYDPAKSQNDYNIVTQYGYDGVGHQTFITDTLGYVTRNEYDSAGRLWKTTANYWPNQDPYYLNQYNLITTYSFDAAGNVTSKIDPLLRETRTEYDELNRVKKVIVNYQDGVYNAAEPDKDLITQTTYDQVGNVQTTTDPLLHVTRTDYDRLNRPIQVTVNYNDGSYSSLEPDKDLVTRYHYDSVGNRDWMTNTLTYDTHTEYDTLNRVSRVTQNPWPEHDRNYQNVWNIVTEYGYNEIGSRVAVTDTFPHVTKNEYDALNRLKTVTANYVQGAPADWQTNVATSYTYDALGNRKTETDPLTHVTSWDYDALGHVLTETRPLANVTAYAYDPRGNRTQVIDPRTHSTGYGYDALSRNTLITDTLGQVTRYVYDAGGRRTQEIDPLTHSTTYAYDDADRQTTVTDALTHITRYGYDGLGNRVKLTDGRSVITAYWYDAANRLKGVIENYVQGGGSDQQTNVTTEYAYDGLGSRTVITDALGHPTHFTYDRLNRLHSEADALSHTTTYDYYPTGQRSMLTDAKNHQTLYTYDNLYRLKQTVYSADGTSEQFGYDAVGNRKLMTDTVGVTQYSYDELNRLKQVIDPYNQTVGYEYDGAGNRTLITYPDNKQVTYSYNPVNRLESVKDWTNQWTYYGYDAASRPVTETLPNGVTTSYAFDNANRLTGLSHTTGGGSVVLGDYQFGLDAVGNRTAITETLQPAWLGGARWAQGALQIMLPLVANQSQPAIQSSQNPILLPLVSNQWQPGIQSSQNQILLPFLSTGNGGVGPSQTGPTLFPIQPRSQAPGQVPTVALPTPNQTAAPKTAVPGQTRVPTRALVAPTAAPQTAAPQTAAPQTATPTDQVRSGLLPRAVESVAASATLTTTFHPVADAYVDSSHPTVNYGTATQLRVDHSPTVNSYLRFSVQGLTGIFSRVTLKLYATSAQSTGYTVQAVADNTWTETGITYNNAPAMGSSLGSSGPVTANTWTSVDVTSYVTGNGTFSVGLTTSNNTALNLASREAGANAPQLVVETAPPAMETTAIGYTYDPLSRLTRASYSGSSTSTFAYAYDAVGNRTVQTQTITSTLVTNYGYDVANRLTNVNGVTYSWDDNGNLLSDGAKSYGYDQANRLKQVVQGAITTTLAYNGVGDRLQQTVGAATTHYVLDPAAGLTQVLSDGTNTYLYGNDRLAQYQTAMQYFGPDALGSVRQIYDASGAVVGNGRYDPYGNVMSQGGTTSVFAFAGEQYDAGTGLEYLRARYYSSAQGRFNTRDTWEGDYEQPLSLNRWNYTSSNPVNRTDPSGHDGGVLEWETPLQACLRNPAACVGAGISAFSVSPEITVVVVGGVAMIVAMPSMEVITCWTIQDIGPNYPMPATYQPGAIQSTYSLPQAGTLSIGATSVVYAKTGSEIFAHVGMLMGGATVGGIPPHPGKPDPDGRDRKHNVEGLRNTLRDELDKMQRAWGKNRPPDLARWLAENGWKQEDILDAVRFLQNYAKYVLPNDVANYGVSEQLESEILSLLRLMGVMP